MGGEGLCVCGSSDFENLSIYLIRLQSCTAGLIHKLGRVGRANFNLASKNIDREISLDMGRI